MRILYLIPGLGPGGAAKQLSLLAAALPRDRFEPVVCCLGREGPFAEPLRRAGVRVDVLGWQRIFDPAPFVRLSRLVQELRPDVVHAWGPIALRVARWLPALHRARLIVSAPFVPRERGPWTGWLDRWLLRRVERVLVFGPREAEGCRRSGVPDERMVRVPPAVAVEAAPAAALDFPVSARCIACVGPLETSKGFRDAVWAFDILRHVVDDIHLLLVGEGPDRCHLERFIAVSRTSDVVHVLGPCNDVPDVLARAEVVWVPSRTMRGLNVALEAQAAGRPVVATRQPELSEVIADGQTGFLVRTGDKVALARQTRLLLDNAALRLPMGAAARLHAVERFPVAELVRRCAAVYSGG